MVVLFGLKLLCAWYTNGTGLFDYLSSSTTKKIHSLESVAF